MHRTLLAVACIMVVTPAWGSGWFKKGKTLRTDTSLSSQPAGFRADPVHLKKQRKFETSLMPQSSQAQPTQQTYVNIQPTDEPGTITPGKSSHSEFGDGDCGDAGPPDTVHGESPFCSYEAMAAARIRFDDSGLTRAIAFKFGDYYFVSYGVGSSDPSAVQSLYTRVTGNPALPSEYKNCTILLNEAENSQTPQITWNNPQPFPAGKNISTMQDSFVDYEPKIEKCLDEKKFAAVGCKEEHHRGPTWAAGIFKKLKCSDAHAVNIACRMWGRGTAMKKVKDSDRLKFVSGLPEAEARRSQRSQANSVGRTPAQRSVWDEVIESAIASRPATQPLTVYKGSK